MGCRTAGVGLRVGAFEGSRMQRGVEIMVHGLATGIVGSWGFWESWDSGLRSWASG